jgi:hypothetical protein
MRLTAQSLEIWGQEACDPHQRGGGWDDEGQYLAQAGQGDGVAIPNQGKHADAGGLEAERAPLIGDGAE